MEGLPVWRWVDQCVYLGCIFTCGESTDDSECHSCAFAVQNSHLLVNWMEFRTKDSLGHDGENKKKSNFSGTTRNAALLR